MNDCAGYREWISRLQDRRLDAPERDRLSDHLAACPDCRRAVEEIEAADTLLRRVEPLDLPPGFDDQVMSRLKEPARGVSGSQVSLIALAAALLVAVGVYIAHRQHEENRIVAEIQAQLGVVKPFMNSISALPDPLPNEDLEWTRVEATALNLHDRIQAIKSQPLGRLKEGAEVARFVRQAETLLTTLSTGDGHRIRTEARHPDLRALQFTTATPNPAIDLTFPRNTAQSVRDLVIGHISLSRGDYGTAVEKLTAAARASNPAPKARYWLAEAHQNRGEVSKALGAYAGCLQFEQTRWLALQAIKTMGTKHEVYVNRTPAAKFDIELFAGSTSDVTLLYRPASEATWTLIGSPDTECIKTFGTFYHAETPGFTFNTSDGVGTVEFKVHELKSSLPEYQWVVLKKQEPMQVVLEPVVTVPRSR